MIGVETRFYRPSWIEIRRDLLVANYLKIKKSIASDSVDVMAVVKANAYGHGASAISQGLEGAGVSLFGVSSIDEAIALRKSGVSGRIIVLGSCYPMPESFEACWQYSLTPTISSVEAARELKSFLLGKEKPFFVHVKIETGMQRIGVRPETAVTILEVLSLAPQVVFEGIYTHFASASDLEETKKQIETFKQALALMKQAGCVPRYIHAANSTTIMKYPEAHFDCVRPGLALYGAMEGFEPIAEMKSRIVFLKEVGPGTKISYEGRFVTKRKSKIATIPLGYADGLPINASSKAWVLVRGERAPACGCITMDMLMADATDIEGVRVGDAVTVIGRDGLERITPQDWARSGGISVYQFLANLGGTRVPKIYHG